MTSSRGRLQKWFMGATSLLVVLLSFSLAAQDAEARRLGAGKSFGRQSQNVTRQQAAPQPQPAQGATANPAQPQPAGNRWLGPLGGLAAGLGISALLSHFGLMGPFASAMGSILMVGLLILAGVLIWRLFAARGNTAFQRASGPVFNSQPLRTPVETMGSGQTMGSGSSTNVYGAPLREPSAGGLPVAATWNVPADFDVAEFLRSAKVYFTRLQAAWDVKDLDDIRRFTTPEVFAEIKMQKDEAVGKADRTEIEHLDASLLGIETTPTEYLASVRFTGNLREDGGNAESVEEVWNLAKPVNGRSGWLLAGIQQVH